MKAIVQAGYSPPERVLSLREVDEPVPGEGEVLVGVRAASVADVASEEYPPPFVRW